MGSPYLDNRSANDSTTTVVRTTSTQTLDLVRIESDRQGSITSAMVFNRDTRARPVIDIRHLRAY